MKKKKKKKGGNAASTPSTRAGRRRADRRRLLSLLRWAIRRIPKYPPSGPSGWSTPVVDEWKIKLKEINDVIDEG